jgi:hypothetical protein
MLSQKSSGLESHIFLSACHADELAREDSLTGHRRFMTALLKVFNMTLPDQLTYGQVLERLELVFESPVQSGLLAPSALDHNCNRSFHFQKLPKTGLNHDRPVFCSLLRLQDQF